MRYVSERFLIIPWERAVKQSGQDVDQDLAVDPRLGHSRSLEQPLLDATESSLSRVEMYQMIN